MIRITDRKDKAAIAMIPSRPSPEELAAAPVLDNWIFNGLTLVGDVYGHPLLPENPSGPPRRIETSRVRVFAPGLGWARTVNRFYRLGRPATETDQ